MVRKFTRRDHPPRHAIGNSSCNWEWNHGWDESHIRGPHRVCKCRRPSRAEVFRYIIDNYVSDDPEDYLPGGVVYQNWRNWSLVCADWADVLRGKMFEHRHLTFDSKADMDDVLFTLKLQVRQPQKSRMYDNRMKSRTFYVQTLPSWDDPRLAGLQSGGYGWLHIRTHSPSPTTHDGHATAASLPPEIWTTIGAYVDDEDDARVCSLVCVDWARGCRSEGHYWWISINSREDMELFLEFTQRQTRFPRLVDFISELWIYQEPSSPLWFDLLSHIRSDPILARRLQPALHRDHPALEINLRLWGDHNDVTLLHSSIARSLPWSIYSDPPWCERIQIRYIQLRSFRELRHIATGAWSSTEIYFERVTCDVAKVSPLPIQLYVMSPGSRIPTIRAEDCTSNILVALAAFSSLARSPETSRQSGHKCVPLSMGDQDIIRTLLMDIYEDANDILLRCPQYVNCAFTSLFDLYGGNNLRLAFFASWTHNNGWPAANICTVCIEHPGMLHDYGACMNMFQKWSPALPALLKLPALRTVIFQATEQSELPDLFRHVVDVIGSEPAAVTFRYTYEIGWGEDKVYYEVTRNGLYFEPVKEWKSKEEMLKAMIQ